MPFMVIYSTSDGASCHEQADAIDEAALFVERLRNKEGIEEIHIYRMEEINFAFRPYYKVELGMPERSGTTPSLDVLDTVPPKWADEPVIAAESAVEAPPSVEGAVADANGRRGLFGR